MSSNEASDSYKSTQETTVSIGGSLAGAFAGAFSAGGGASTKSSSTEKSSKPSSSEKSSKPSSIEEPEDDPSGSTGGQKKISGNDGQRVIEEKKTSGHTMTKSQVKQKYEEAIEEEYAKREGGA